MKKAINDATLVKVGDIFQYYIALRDCFFMKSGNKIQIEINGDISLITDTSKTSFQKEVKHHFGDNNLSDRDIDFWKTLANWYKEYNRINIFSHLILHTTTSVTTNSQFANWNTKDPSDKLLILKAIGVPIKPREKTFREQYDNIFKEDIYDEDKLLNILSRFTIEHSQNQIEGISSEFSSFVGHIPESNRDKYIGALLGQILSVVKDPPHKWEVTREAFDKILQQTSPSFSNEKETPLPTEYAEATVPQKEATLLEQKNFVAAIKNINYDAQIPDAVSDYWKTEMTVIRYFKDDLLYIRSLPRYKDNLRSRLKYTKESKKLESDSSNRDDQIKHSKLLYNQVMAWDAKDFESIIRNQGYFQRGVIHNIVDEKDFDWDVGEKDES